MSRLPFSSFLLGESELLEKIKGTFPEMETKIGTIPFHPDKDRLVDILNPSVSQSSTKASIRPAFSIMAPYFFLQQDGIRAEMRTPPFESSSIRLFANNFTVQDLKIKGCKPTLHLMHFWLALLDAETLAASPFMTEKEGIHMVDLRLIPEKYRLDIKSAERILTEGFLHWLNIIGNSDK
jgi:hypothetical protein